MKRITAWVLAFCLAVGCILPAQATEPSAEERFSFQTETPADGSLQGASPKTEADAAGKTETPTETGNGAEGETQTETESETQTETETQTKTPTETETPTESEAPTETETPTESEAPTETETPTDSETKPGEVPTESETETPSETETETLPETKTETETEPVSNQTVSGNSVSGNSVSSNKIPAKSIVSDDRNDWNKGYAPSQAEGGIEVLLENALPVVNRDLTVNVHIDGGSLGERSQEVKLQTGLLQEPGVNQELVSFEGLQAGEYRLTITAPGYAVYEQTVSVRGDIKTIVVYTGSVVLDGCAYTQNGVHPGILLIGDVNGDGMVGEDDRDIILDAMCGRAVADGTNPDLDGNGKTDLVDLQYYTNSREILKANLDTISSVTSRISPKAVGVNLNEEGTQIKSGNPEDLLGKDGSVVFQNINRTEISEENPVEFGFHLLSEEQDNAGENVYVEQIVISMGQNAIDSGVVFVETPDGEASFDIQNGAIVTNSRMFSARNDAARESDRRLIIDLGNRTAVKRVSIRITGTQGDKALAEITQVEFLNDMEKRIPAPDRDIPQNLQVVPADKSFLLTWDQARNVTGYEVQISSGGYTETLLAASNRLEVKSFRGDKLKNGETYEVRVQSVNGAWVSGYGEAIKAVPVITKKPDPPDNLRAVGGYRCVRMSWKDMEDTDTYNVYWRKSGESSFTKVSLISSNRYEITGLEDQTVYEVYVTGTNDLGESGPSLLSEAKTITLNPPQMPKYKLLNESNGKGKVSAHIVSVTHGRGGMVSSPLDTDNKSALGTVDKDFASSYQIMDWDDGGVYVSPDKGLLFTLDDYYEMNYITFAETEDIASFSKVSVYYYDKEHPNGTYAEKVSVLQRTDGNGRKYYAVKLAQPITANKIRLGFTRYGNLRNIVIAEVNFYYYDSLEDDILALYADDLHTVLREDVTEETINALQKRLDTPDEKSGEYHPERIVLQRELDNARGLLGSGFNDVVEINPQITAAKDRHLKFSGLNAWQPLGITAYEGESLVVYVGHNSLRTGANSFLQLVATQYHAEAGSFASVVANLKVGRNEITVPSLQSLACEGGGALYIQYTGNNANDRYAVRVSGGAREAVLNLYGVSDAKERMDRITAYVEQLEEQVRGQEEQHKLLHEGTEEGNKVNRPYDEKNCILGATDIVLNRMMLSVSAKQILAGLGNGSLQERADKLDQSLRAMDGMINLFYHHKGLNDGEGVPAKDRIPAQHLNIRYMRMFAGAFMYASGNHVGIEWGSVPGLAGASPVLSEANGKYISGNYFGWGIAHEIGHNINQSTYAIAEVTNNYFSLLAAAKDSNDSVRFKYPEVYKKVTSNTVGRASNVFTQLAMYWQLHLAYDRDYNYKIYDSYEEQHEKLFYARLDTYGRDPSLAPGSLNLGQDKDQNLMRLACAAANRDLTEFFTRWGLVPDDETIGYAGQFPREERALYYLTDDARVYEIEHGTSGSIQGTDVITQGSSVVVNGKIPNEVTLTIDCQANSDVILGYEIARYHYEKGLPVRQVIGFSTENVYVDHVSVINNRVLTYEVTAVDKFGYRSNVALIGDVLISHDGSHDKSMWTVTTNMTSTADEEGTATQEDPCAPEKVSAVYRVIDNDYTAHTYTGRTGSGDAAILLRLNKVLSVCGLKYTAASGNPVGAYEIQVSIDGNTWTTVKQGQFEEKNGSQTVYFENAQKDPWICTYDAAYVRFRAIGQSEMNVTEIDLLGPSGDTISFGTKEDSTTGAVGILQEEYIYETSSGKKIPKGSLVFMGSYKGNPAYNVVMLYCEDGSVVGGTDEQGVLRAEQIILANVPENGLLGEVSDGIWIYWIEPDAQGQIPAISGKVRAQLFRVDNALTNGGERIVSDTLPLQMPNKLDSITLKQNLDAQ